MAERVLIFVCDLDRRFVDVDAGRLRRSVTKDRLHRRFAYPAADHFRCQPVPERVWRDFTFDATQQALLADDVLPRARADRVAGVSDLVAATERGGRPGAANLIAAQ